MARNEIWGHASGWKARTEQATRRRVSSCPHGQADSLQTKRVAQAAKMSVWLHYILSLSQLQLSPSDAPSIQRRPVPRLGRSLAAQTTLAQVQEDLPATLVARKCIYIELLNGGISYSCGLAS